MSIADASRIEQGVWQSADGGFTNEGTVLNSNRIVRGISEVFGVRKTVIRGKERKSRHSGGSATELKEYPYHFSAIADA
jgi:hypothetical protein